MNREECYGTVRCYVGIYTGLVCNILDMGNSCWCYSITTVRCIWFGMVLYNAYR